MSNGVERAVQELAIEISKNNILLDKFLEAYSASEETRKEALDLLKGQIEFLQETCRNLTSHDLDLQDKVLDHKFDSDDRKQIHKIKMDRDRPKWELAKEYGKVAIKYVAMGLAMFFVGAGASSVGVI